jgi:peptidoglycan/LPS O-acetylase OafA/YrhL
MALAAAVGRKPHEVFSIQVLRALAAIAVVIAHIADDLTERALQSEALPRLDFFQAGVDVFFVISGFVMVYASESLFAATDAPKIFLLRRLNRIVPLYWLVTTTYLAIAWLASDLPHKGYSAGLAVASYLFIPWAGPDDTLEPIVGQGWTLNYEMLFYVLFAVAIAAPRRIAVALVSTALVLAVLAGSFFQPTSAIPKYWSNEITLEFVLGMLLGLAYAEGVRLPRVPRMLLIAAGVCLIYVAAPQLGGVPLDHRALLWGTPAAMIVAGSVFGFPAGPLPGLQSLALLGDASYALYLVHSLPVRAFRKIWLWSSLTAGVSSWIYLALALAVTTAVGVLVHLYVERPIGRRSRMIVSAR